MADDFELLFEANPRPMFVFDRETLAIVAANAAVVALYGWTRDELLAMTIRDLRRPEDAERLAAALARQREHSKARFTLLSRHVTKSGQLLDVDVEMSRIVLGGRSANLCVVIDLSAGETALRRSEANFRTLIERLPTGTIVHREGRVIYINPAAVRGLRYDTADEIVGRGLLEFVHPDDRAQVIARARQTAIDGRAPPAESRMLRRDGTIAFVEAEAVMLDFDGLPANVVIAHEVTERRELFARVATADRLVSMGTLAAGVAHEINNPLAYLVSNLEILAREIPASQASRLADAREAADRVSAIVRDLRELTRPGDDTTTPVDVIAILASSIKMANNELRHRARVVTDCAAELPRVEASPSRLGQVFLNLLVNAAHAMVEGRADAMEVRVRARATADRGHVVVEIADTGSGIPPEILGRVFDPFFTTKPLGAGIGLGLAISHQIIKSLGGEIAVASTVGAGTTFTITLRAAAAPAIAAAPIEVVVVTPVARALSILVVDDEELVGRAVAGLLEPEHAVVAETQGSAALARIAAGERFDVILCDLMMPEMNGMEVFERLSPRDRERLVFITGGAFTPQARVFLTTTPNARLDKPFTEERLRDAIDRVVR